MPSLYDIQKVKQGNSFEFRLFFESLYPKLMALACRFVNVEIAKDLVQEVFVQYWEQKQNVEASNILSYLYKCLQNKCLNYIKHQAVIDGYVSRVQIAQARIDYMNNTDDHGLFKQLSDQNLREMVELSVSKLPEKCQQAFRLCYFHDMNYKDIAQVMGISHRTVEGHIQKAIAFLRDELRGLFILLLIAV